MGRASAGGFRKSRRKSFPGVWPGNTANSKKIAANSKTHLRANENEVPEIPDVSTVMVLLLNAVRRRISLSRCHALPSACEGWRMNSERAAG
jgi:hypothetical protein